MTLYTAPVAQSEAQPQAPFAVVPTSMPQSEQHVEIISHDYTGEDVYLPTEFDDENQQDFYHH